MKRVRVTKKKEERHGQDGRIRTVKRGEIDVRGEIDG